MAGMRAFAHRVLFKEIEHKINLYFFLNKKKIFEIVHVPTSQPSY